MSVATRTNEEVKKDVVDQLYWDGRVDASNVKVEVSEGEVVLTGTVPHYAAYNAANEDAWAVSGVRYVRNDMTIKYPVDVKVPTDAEIKANIENILLWQPNIDSTDIDVFVENGWVTLRGSVDAFWKKIRAEELILGLSGVLGITNELAIVPTKEFTDKTIAEDIEAAMERDFNIDVDLIDVEVENGRVTLTGSVPSLPAFRAAKRIVENTLGVLMVDNQLVIR
jgi:osmotically-inducible protein OsmY